MAPRMPCPMKRRGSSFHQFRKRVPSDLLGKTANVTLTVPVEGRTLTKRLSPRAREVVFSLGTRDPAEAKRRQAVALVYLEGVWEGLRNGPKSLTQKQTVALSGEVYRALAEGLENNPGPPDRWRKLLTSVAEAQAGMYQPLQIGLDRARALEKRFGKIADLTLARHGIQTDAVSRRRLIEEVARAVTDAGFKLWQNAEGDYRPDPTSERFPAVELQSAAVTFTELLRGWWTEAKAGGRSQRTLEAYRGAISKFAAFLGHDDATRVTDEDVVRFKDHRLAQGISLKTIRDSDLASLKSLYRWALANRRLKNDPVAGIRVPAQRRAVVRSKGFSDEEAATILTHALEVQRGRQSPQTFAAKRWVPWIMAYSGARVGEIGQLRKEDVVRRDGIDHIRITPEAGAVKDKKARDVPLHAHLIEMGFLSFVEACPAGSLFLKPGSGGDVLGPLRGLKNRLTEFVRIVLLDKRVAPNHGWRHRFKTVGREVGIADTTLDAIAGHAAASIGAAYGDVSLKTKATAVARLPRYDVDKPRQT